MYCTSWRHAAAVALLALLARAAVLTGASLTCKCGTNYLPETDSSLTECNRTTASCQGAGTCALSATLSGNGFVKLNWFCLSGAPDRWFVTKSLCHGPHRDKMEHLCCSNYSMCNADLNTTLVATVHPTSSDQSLPVPTQLSNRSNSVSMHYVVPAAITSSLVTLLILLALVLILTFTIRAKRRAPTVEDIAVDTITSGSGSGKPYLTKRTFSRRVSLLDITLGQGRFGKVSLGCYQKEAVAVKRFPSAEMDSWLHETLVFDLCMHHDAIVGFVAADSYCLDGNNEYWLVTCFHPHGSLYGFLRTCEREVGGAGGGRVLSVADLLRMASTACSGLAHLHTPLVGYKGKPPIAHRDIKSTNILVKGDLTCCLADMGLAFVGGRNGDSQPTAPSLVTRWDLGTTRYLSPEILCSQRYPSMDVQRQVLHYIRSDIYAMALVIWEMCRRTVIGEGHCDPCALPYEGMVSSDPSVQEMRKVVCSMKERPPISERWNSNPVLVRMVDLMQECWRDHPHARPSSLYLKYALLKMYNAADTP